jgi:Tol biopolymer transport system component
LSPDGHWIASATKIGINQNTAIRLFSVADGTVQKITVASGAGLSNLDWAADGKSLWVTSFTTDDSWTLLNVDLQGKVRPIFKDERMRIGWAIPSPDGKRLAMWESSGSSNVWMLEDF